MIVKRWSAMLLFGLTVLVSAPGCDSKPAPVPAGAETKDEPLDVQLGEGSESAPAAGSAEEKEDQPAAPAEGASAEEKDK